ncbi:YMGG-like glycine zipper-containing protein [Thermodesulfobacteriota bacterium]
MKKVILGFLGVIITTFVAGSALAQDPIVFPAKGQSQDQMEKDKFACYSWAKQETGFDPMKVPTTTSPPPQQRARRGGALKGAAVGAGVGAIVKKDDSRSKGARRGAVAGGLVGGAVSRNQRRKDEQARKQWEQEQAAQYAQKRNTYNRAYAACLEAKGYTVK